MGRICADIVLNCDSCKKIFSDLCFPSFDLEVGLTPLDVVYLWVIDKFGNIYRDQVTVQLDGSIEVLTSNYPQGLFQVSQIFDIFVSSDEEAENILPLFSDPAYNCIAFTVGNNYLVDGYGNPITTGGGKIIIV